MRYSVERIEENIALCEDDGGELVKIKLCELPRDIREGDIIVKTKSGYTADESETQARRKKIAQKQRSLFNKKEN